MAKKNTYVAGLVDEYGELSDQIKALEKQKEAIKKKLQDSGVTQPGMYYGAAFSLELIESVSYEFDSAKAFDLLGKEKFILCSKIQKTKLDDVMVTADQQKIITGTKLVIKFVPKSL